MKTVVVDAYDSFVHIIDQYLRTLRANPIVIRSDAATVGRVRAEAPDLLVLGPGPGHPADSGHVELVRAFATEVPVFGVCLGHQALGVAFGARVSPAEHLMHGKTSRIEHDGRGAFAQQPQGFLATRYHSLVVEEATVPGQLEVTARSCDDGYVMGLRHRELRLESVQFHPESITTELGLEIFRSFLRQAVTADTGVATECG